MALKDLWGVQAPRFVFADSKLISVHKTVLHVLDAPIMACRRLWTAPPGQGTTCLFPMKDPRRTLNRTLAKHKNIVMR